MKNVMKAITILMLFLYFLIITYVIVFKANVDLLTSGGIPEFRSVSFAPCFNGKESLLNIAAFLPLGLFLMLTASSPRILPKVAACLMVSIAFEVAQYGFMVGTSDITDLITNTIGGFIGCCIYRACEAVLKDKTKAILQLLGIPFTIALGLFVFFVF